MRILVVKLGALGDVLMALPALRLLRASLPEANITWLIEERNARAVENCPDVDRVLRTRADVWRKELRKAGTRREIFELVRTLRAQRFKLALDLQGLVKSAIWARMSGAPIRVGLPANATREALSGWFYPARSPEARGRHVSDTLLAAARDSVRALGGTPLESTAVEFPLTQPEREWADATLRRLAPGRRAVLVQPGAGWVTKLWGSERFARVASALAEHERVKVLVTHAPSERHLAESVVTAATTDAVVPVACDVGQLAALCARASLFVAGDTGPYHLARVVGTPTVGLFGPTDPARNGPHLEDDPTLWAKVSCSPCYLRQCPTQVECLTAVEPDAVLRACLSVLRKGSE